MPTWLLRILRAPLHLSVTALLAMSAYGAEPEPPSVPLHPLVNAAEAVYQRNQLRACDALMKQAAMAPGLTDEDLSHLQFLTSLRALDDGDEVAARRAVARALRVDQAAAPPPPFASRLGKLVEEARTSLPQALAGDRGSRLAAARKTAGERELAPVALLRAVDLLYSDMQIDGAGVVLDLAQASAAPVQAQVALRRGILRMEVGDHEGARAAFKGALEADRSISLPDYAPPKTHQVFNEVKQAIPMVIIEQKPVAIIGQKPAESSQRPGGHNHTAAWIVAGASAVALVGGGVFGARTLISRSPQDAVTANVFYGIGGGLALTSAALFYFQF